VVVFETETAPYIVVRQSGQVPVGKGCSDNFTIDIIYYDKSYDEVKALSAAGRSALESASAGTANSVAFGYLNFMNEVDGDYVKEHKLYTRIATFEGSAE